VADPKFLKFDTLTLHAGQQPDRAGPAPMLKPNERLRSQNNVGPNRNA
jgi:hypothetical protein